ncbi:MAG: hydrogenase maturation nickel metallochaperone HypA [Myxococcota bacterium]
MHELSVTRNIVAIVAEKAGKRPVKRVKLVIGKLAGIEVPAIRFCFDVVAKGTVVEGATLEIEEPAGRGSCRECGEEMGIARLVATCPCERRARIDIVSGEELLVREMET